jgi:hypothetical protein
MLLVQRRLHPAALDSLAWKAMSTILADSFQALSLARRCSYLSDSERQRFAEYFIYQSDCEDDILSIVHAIADGDEGLPPELRKRIKEHWETWLAKSNAQVEFERSVR